MLEFLNDCPSLLVFVNLVERFSKAAFLVLPFVGLRCRFFTFKTGGVRAVTVRQSSSDEYLRFSSLEYLPRKV